MKLSTKTLLFLSFIFAGKATALADLSLEIRSMYFLGKPSLEFYKLCGDTLAIGFDNLDRNELNFSFIDLKKNQVLSTRTIDRLIPFGFPRQSAFSDDCSKFVLINNKFSDKGELAHLSGDRSHIDNLRGSQVEVFDVLNPKLPPKIIINQQQPYAILKDSNSPQGFKVYYVSDGSDIDHFHGITRPASSDYLVDRQTRPLFEKSSIESKQWIIKRMGGPFSKNTFLVKNLETGKEFKLPVGYDFSKEITIQRFQHSRAGFNFDSYLFLKGNLMPERIIFMLPGGSCDSDSIQFEGKNFIYPRPRMLDFILRGSAVVVVNYRNNRAKGFSGQCGKEDLADVELTREFYTQRFSETPFYLWGISMGGYLANLIATSDTSSNWLGFISDVGFWDPKDALEDPESRNFTSSRAPINGLGNITAPIAVYWGGGDVRYPESMYEDFITEVGNQNLENIHVLISPESGHSDLRDYSVHQKWLDNVKNVIPDL